MEIKDINSAILDIRKSAMTCIARACAEYGKFTIDKGINNAIFSTGLFDSDTFYLEGLEFDSDTDSVKLLGYYENHYSNEHEYPEEPLHLDDIMYNTEALASISAIVYYQYENSPYDNPAMYIGVSDWADHYENEIRYRWETLKETYSL